jgi:hypothetical protein
MMQQSTSSVIMVRPDHFGFNPETAETNPFQHISQSLHKEENEIRSLALNEFENMVQVLQQCDIEVLVLPSRKDVVTPDAVFPNNWFSHHYDGTLVLYPMLAENRRLERQKEALLTVLKKADIPVHQIIDLTKDEDDGFFLESTGSMTFDRVHKVAFAIDSPRSIQSEFEKWCSLLGYDEVYLQALPFREKEVYHTNLEMSIGSDFALICMDVFGDEKEKNFLVKKIESLGKICIEISIDQVHSFCGNVLEVQNRHGKKFLLMSETAYHAYTSKQLALLNDFVEPLVFSIPTIEIVGGGGVRCMVAEVFR